MLRTILPPPPRANQSPAHERARVFVQLNRCDRHCTEIRRLKRDMLAAERLLLGKDADFNAAKP